MNLEEEGAAIIINLAFANERGRAKQTLK